MGIDYFVLSIIAIAVGLPVIFGIGGDVAKRYIKMQERKMELMADRSAERATQYAAVIERLESRMRVLERIATDKGINLAHQIEALREDEHGASATADDVSRYN